MGIVFGIIAGGLVIMGLITGLIYIYLPKFPCPEEEECSAAWDKIKSEGDPEQLHIFHNCRIRHRAKGIKPEKFRPRCETYCAFAKREGETAGRKSNPLEWLFCLEDTFGGGDPEEESTEPDTGDSQSETLGTIISDAQDEVVSQDGFQNSQPDKEPSGYGEYY
jgi:hypothetical protein